MTDVLQPTVLPADAARLDDPIWHALGSGHARLARTYRTARRYPSEVSPFAAMADYGPAGFADLAALVAPGETVGFFTAGPVAVPGGWSVAWSAPLLQMVCPAPVDPGEASGIGRLGRDDVDDMLALVEETKPGPFGRDTIEMGRYYGIRDGDGRLLAMTGERLDLGSAAEVSAVCTSPAARGRGLADRLIRHVAGQMQGEGRLPFLHVVPDNPARRVYERCGFVVHADRFITAVQRDG